MPQGASLISHFFTGDKEPLKLINSFFILLCRPEIRWCTKVIASCHFLLLNTLRGLFPMSILSVFAKQKYLLPSGQNFSTGHSTTQYLMSIEKFPYLFPESQETHNVYHCFFKVTLTTLEGQPVCEPTQQCINKINCTFLDPTVGLRQKNCRLTFATEDKLL